MAVGSFDNDELLECWFSFGESVSFDNIFPSFSSHFVGFRRIPSQKLLRDALRGRRLNFLTTSNPAKQGKRFCKSILFTLLIRCRPFTLFIRYRLVFAKIRLYCNKQNSKANKRFISLQLHCKHWNTFWTNFHSLHILQTILNSRRVASSWLSLKFHFACLDATILSAGTKVFFLRERTFSRERIEPIKRKVKFGVTHLLVPDSLRCGPYGYSKRNNSGGNICNKTNKTRNMKKKIIKKETTRARRKDNDSGSGCYVMSVTHVSMNLPFITKRAGTLKVGFFVYFEDSLYRFVSNFIIKKLTSIYVDSLITCSKIRHWLSKSTRWNERRQPLTWKGNKTRCTHMRKRQSPPMLIYDSLLDPRLFNISNCAYRRICSRKSRQFP